MDDDITALRSVCTARISEPFWSETARNQSSRRLACAVRAMRSGRRCCASAREISYATSTAIVANAAHQLRISSMNLRRGDVASGLATLE